MRKIYLTLFIILLFFFLGSRSLFAKIVDGIVAVVNGEIITFSDIRDLSKKEGSKDIKALLNQLIEMKLIDQEAKKYKIEVSDEEVNEALDRILEVNKIDIERLKETLRLGGESLLSYKKELKREILRMKLLSIAIRQKFVIKEEDIAKYYETHREEFDHQRVVRVSHIFISKEKGRLYAYKRALHILSLIKRGMNFSEAAKRFSESPSATYGGDIGFFKRGEMVPSLEKVAFSLKPGEISGIIETRSGFNIIKVTEIKDEGPKPPRLVKKEIERILYKKEFDTKFREWLKALKSKSYIEVKRGFLKQVAESSWWKESQF